jgi:hypothetical protein
MFNKHGIPGVHSGIRTLLQYLHETWNSCSVFSKQGTPALYSASRQLLQCV